ALLRRIEEHDDPPYRSTREELSDSARGEWTNLEENSLAGFDPDGLLRAYGVVTEPEEGDRPRSFLEGGVDPDERHRGVGSAMLGWQVERARELLAAAEGEGQLIVHVEDGMNSCSELVERHGFVPGGTPRKCGPTRPAPPLNPSKLPRHWNGGRRRTDPTMPSRLPPGR